MTGGDWRQAWILVAMDGRRRINRFFEGWKRLGATAGRTATPGKQRASAWMGVIAVLALVQVLFLSMQSVGQAEIVSLDRVVVDQRTSQGLRRVDAAVGKDRDRGLMWTRQILFEDRSVLRLPWSERRAKIDALAERWRRDGATAFVSDASTFDVSGGPRGPAELHLVAAMLGAMALMSILCVVGNALGLGNRDLARGDDPGQLLAAQPVSDRAAATARVVAAALTDPGFWLGVPVLLIVMHWRCGWGPWSIPVALALLPGMALMGAGLRVSVEELLRRSMSLTARRWFQGVATAVGMLLLLALIAPGLWRPIGASIAWVGNSCGLEHFPAAWALARPEPLVAAGAAGATLLLGILSAGIAIALAGPLANEVHIPSRRRSGSRVWTGLSALGKDLLLLRRDPLLLMQTLVIPAMLVGFQAVFNRGAAEDAIGDPRHIAAVAMFVGAYPLGMVVLRAFASEVGLLWIPWMTTASPTRMLLGKAMVGAALGASFSGVTVLVMHALGPNTPWTWHAVAAVVACAVLGVMAVPLGALATKIERNTLVRRISWSAGWTLLAAEGTAMAALYVTPTTAIANLIVLAALTAALWQRLDTMLPWILDPTDQPQPRLDAASACGSILAYSVIQTVFALSTMLIGWSPGDSLVLGSAAAAILTIIGSIVVMLRSRVPGTLRACGLLPRDGGAITVRRVVIALGLGVGTGLLCTAWGLAWSHFAEQLGLSSEGSDINGLGKGAFFLLAVTIAPPVEEFLFRGLLLNAVLSWRGGAWALIGSTLLFAVLHPPLGWPAVAIAGFAFGVLALRSGWLLPSIVAHATYNGVIWYLSTSGK